MTTAKVIIVSLLLIYFVVISIVAAMKNSGAKSPAKSKEPTHDILDILYDNMLKYIPKAEKAYLAYKGNSNADTAGMKLNDVLNKLRSDCSALGVLFNEEYWTNEVKTIIDLTKLVNIK